MGIALMVLGAVAISLSFLAGGPTLPALGGVLLLGGLIQVVAALWGRHWKGFFLHLLTGVLYLVIVVFLIDYPGASAPEVALLVAVCLLVGGVVRVVVSTVERFDGWAWALLNGVASTVMGVVIWRQGLLAGPWMMGLFIGIDLVLSGESWVVLGLAVRSASAADSLA